MCCLRRCCTFSAAARARTVARAPPACRGPAAAIGSTEAGDVLARLQSACLPPVCLPVSQSPACLPARGLSCSPGYDDAATHAGLATLTHPLVQHSLPGRVSRLPVAHCLSPSPTTARSRRPSPLAASKPRFQRSCASAAAHPPASGSAFGSPTPLPAG